MDKKPYTITALACIQKSERRECNFGIGFNGDLLYPNCREDMSFFKAATMAGVNPGVIMGRKTWESIDQKYRPLIGRISLVVTRKPDLINRGYDGNPNPPVRAFVDFVEALSWAKANCDNISIAGGEEIYREALCSCDFLVLTEIKGDKPAAVFFPMFDHKFEFDEKVMDGQCNEKTPFVINRYKKKSKPVPQILDNGDE